MRAVFSGSIPCLLCRQGAALALCTQSRVTLHSPCAFFAASSIENLTSSRSTVPSVRPAPTLSGSSVSAPLAAITACS